MALEIIEEQLCCRCEPALLAPVERLLEVQVSVLKLQSEHVRRNRVAAQGGDDGEAQATLGEGERTFGGGGDKGDVGLEGIILAGLAQQGKGAVVAAERQAA